MITNETLQTINNRRSCRNYKTDQVSKDEIEAIINAALYAPSAMNSQKWHFSIIQDQATVKKLMAIMKANMIASGVDFLAQRASAPDFIAFHNAPVIVVISADETQKFSQIDCGAAAENIAVAAESLNIGTCIMTSSELLFAADSDGSLKKELGIPDGYKHICAITLGYKNCDNPQPAPRKNDLITWI